jgi:hypothetical protein
VFLRQSEREINERAASVLPLKAPIDCRGGQILTAGLSPWYRKPPSTEIGTLTVLDFDVRAQQRL